MTKITKHVAFLLVVSTLMSAAGATFVASLEAEANQAPGEVYALKGFHSFFDRHPRLRKASKAAVLGAGIGTGLGIVTGGAMGGAAAGAARGGGFSLVRTSKTWQKAKNKVKGKHADSHHKSARRDDRRPN